LYSGWILPGGVHPTGPKVALIACEVIIIFVLLLMQLAAKPRSLAIPTLLIFAPMVAVPLLLYAVTMHPEIFETDDTPLGNVTVRWAVVMPIFALGVVCMLWGLILLLIRLARRGNKVWIPILVGAVVVFFLCPLPLLVAYFFVGWVTLRPNVEQSEERHGFSDSPVADARTYPASFAKSSSPAPTMITGPEFVIKRFDPKSDKPVTREALGSKITEDEGGWRIDHGAVSNLPQPSLEASPLLLLFEVKGAKIAGCRVTMRAQVKTEAKDPFSQACLEIDTANAGVAKMGPIRNGSTNWSPYEITWDKFEDINPPLFKINARIAWNTSVWIKDLEVVAVRPPGSLINPMQVVESIEPPRFNETIIKKFDPKTDKPFQTEVASARAKVEGTMWVFSTDAAGPDGTSQLILFEIPKQKLANETVIVRLKMKTEKVSGYATVNLAVNGTRYDWVGRYGNNMSTGTTDWKSYELRHDCKEPNPVDLGMVAEIAGHGVLWLKDIEVVKVPTSLQPPRKAQSNEVILKKFTPKEDKPITTEVQMRRVTTEDDGWKIELMGVSELGSRENLPRVHLFQVPAPAKGPSRLTLRFKVKVENVDSAVFEARLQYGVGDQIFKGRTLEGTTNWADHEIAWDASTLEKADAIALDLVLRSKDSSSKATVWIKDVELVKAPRPE
jgi:hypothetical protein